MLKEKKTSFYKYDPENPRWKKVAAYIVIFVCLICLASFIYEYKSTGCIELQGAANMGYARFKLCGPIPFLIASMVSVSIILFTHTKIIKKNN